ncbi:hypothetical protein [Chitinophaga nivalis]|uniref:Polymerase nucleotidyl transferase domain-containing protein n=1 Tax=Chitinophaga nivalis TaxID=2991709 RepID=A0ABT3ISC9_9BACT|nr:hypothetical protein [Chitinophaga nivalis]MCW3463442.1 hypothetical protein [Chitinophaga nivalis]MCW3486868.1 hypothetical protein [Chitinophaga nivalis]
MEEQDYILPPVDIAAIFSVFRDKYIDYRVVKMPDSWRERDNSVFTFILFSEDLDEPELLTFFTLAGTHNLANARPVSKKLLELSSLFHPLFYERFVAESRQPDAGEKYIRFIQGLQPYAVALAPAYDTPVASNRYYLQSLLFLAGCTLSAAIIQQRYTEATIQSKLDRLWQASYYLASLGITTISREALQEFVIHYGSHTTLDAFERISAIKKMYGRLLNELSSDVYTTPVTIQESVLNAAQQQRFGFVPWLREQLGDNLKAVFVYGSSVTSEVFADFDVILYVKDSHTALCCLNGKDPKHNGVDINISVYDETDFYGFQSLSGDNLDENVLCLYGAATIPVKRRTDLIYRNFSFGYVRMRQLLGMAAFLAKEGTHFGLESKSNLYQYFIKIPMHIVKGMRAAMQEPINKVLINKWTKATLDYDIDEQVALCMNGQAWKAISNAYGATLQLLYVLNKVYAAFEPEAADIPAFLQ